MCRISCFPVFIASCDHSERLLSQETRGSRAPGDRLYCPPSNMRRTSHIRTIQSLLSRSCSTIERPLPLRFTSGTLLPSPFDAGKGPTSELSQRWGAWTRLLTQRLWTLRNQEAALARILDALPAGQVCRAIQSGVS